MELEKDVESDELMQEVHQQILCYQEKVNKRFQELEELLGLAAQQLNKLEVRKAKRKKVKFENSFAKTKIECAKEVVPESLQHLKLSFPQLVEGSCVSEWLQDCEQYFSVFKVGENKKVAIAGKHMQGTARKWFQVYTEENNNFVWSEFCKQFIAKFGDWEQELLYDNFKQPQNDTTEELKESPDIKTKLEVFRDLDDADLETCTRKPVYDEEQGEGQECWPEQAFILAALNGGNLGAPNPLQSEICNSKRSEELEDYQEHLRYDEEPGEDKEDWQSEEIFLTVLGLEALSQQKQNLGEQNSSVVEGLDCTTDVRQPFASVPNAVVAHVPKKIHVEKHTIMAGEVEREENYPHTWKDD